MNKWQRLCLSLFSLIKFPYLASSSHQPPELKGLIYQFKKRYLFIASSSIDEFNYVCYYEFIMNLLSISQLASISDLQRNYNALILKAKNLAQPLVLLRRNRPEAVLISIEAYQDLAEKKRLYEEKITLEVIKRFEKDKKAGRLLVGTKAEDLFK